VTLEVFIIFYMTIEAKNYVRNFVRAYYISRRYMLEKYRRAVCAIGYCHRISRVAFTPTWYIQWIKADLISSMPLATIIRGT